MAGTEVLIRFTLDNAGAVTKVRQVREEVEKVPGSADKASAGLGRLKTALVAAASAFAALRVKDFLVSSVREAAAEQEAFNRLAATMATLGIEYNKVSAELQNMFANLQATTAFGDDETASVFQRLVITTGNYDSALKLLNVTLDVAAGKSIDAASAAELVGKAATGYIGILSRYGIVFDEATQKQIRMADAMGKAEIVARELEKRFSGQAQAQLQTYSGQMQQLGNYWGDLKEAIGSTIISLTQWGGKLMSLKDIMKFWTDAILDFGQTMVTAFHVDYSAFFARVLTRVLQTFQLWIGKINLAMQDLPDWMGGGDDAAARAYRAFAKVQEAEEIFANLTVLAFSDAVEAGEEWRKQVENLTSAVPVLANTISGDGGGGGGVSLDKAFLSAGASAAAFNKIISDGANVLSIASEQARQFRDILHGSAGMSVTVYDNLWAPLEEAAEESFDFIGGMFSDLLGKGFMGELDSFKDLWDEIWQDLAKSLVGILGDAFTEAIKGTSGFFTQIKEMLATPEGQLAFGVAGAGMVYSAYQQGGGVGSILQGALGGAMAGAALGSWLGGTVLGMAAGPFGAIAGAVIGGVVAALGSQAQEDPESFVRNLGLDTGTLMTRGHQGMGEELRALWIRQQQNIMRSYIRSYHDVLRLFENEDLFALIGATPTFDTAGWMGMGADQLATWLQEEFWPSAFMNMFQEAISTGLEGLGVTSGTLDQLWDELEALPGEERMGALTTYVSSLVNLSDLMAEMDWNAILDAVGQDSLTTFMLGIEDIAHSIDVLMMGMSDMTLLERAEQAQEIEQLIVQVRQAEIQYLQQLDSLQRGVNQSIEAMLEQFQIGDMGTGQQQAYYQQRIAEIMALLSGGQVSSPEQLQQLMADLQRYIQALAGSLGENLFEPMDIMGWGQTWADYLSGILEQAQGYSDDYFEQFRDEIRTANEELIEALRDLIDALTDFQGGTLGGGDSGYGGGHGGPNPNPEGAYSPQVNVFLEGSMAALRPFVRAEIRDSLAGRPRGIN